MDRKRQRRARQSVCFKYNTDGHELDEPVAAKALRDVRQLAEAGTVTLLTSAKDVEHGHLVVLRRLLEKRS